MADKGGMDEDDRKLWSHIASHLTPLPMTLERRIAAKRRIEKVRPVPKPEPALEKPAKKTVRPRAAVTAKQAMPLPAPKAPEDRRGRVAGVDRRTAERLRRGQYPINARLDLHGLNQAQAHNALRLFVRQCHAANKRCLLVITGKGGRQRPANDGPYVNAEPPGVLKRALPGWLKDPDLGPLVLSTATATPEHGGGGAIYILLRRRR